MKLPQQKNENELGSLFFLMMIRTEQAAPLAASCLILHVFSGFVCAKGCSFNGVCAKGCSFNGVCCENYLPTRCENLQGKCFLELYGLKDFIMEKRRLLLTGRQNSVFKNSINAPPFACLVLRMKRSCWLSTVCTLHHVGSKPYFLLHYLTKFFGTGGGRKCIPCQPPPGFNSCSSCLINGIKKLHKMWDEIGESYNEIDNILEEIEQECLDVYDRKIAETIKYKAELQGSLAQADDEIVSLMSSLGEQVTYSRKEEDTLKQQISTVKPVLDELRMKKGLRWKQISEILTRITDISSNIAGNDDHGSNNGPEDFDESDLTETKLDQLRARLQDLCKEKDVRLQKVNSYISAIHDLSEAMAFDFSEALKLTESLKNEKLQKLLRVIIGDFVQDLGRTLQDLWNRMETPMDERRRFENISSLLSVQADDALPKGCLGHDIFPEAEDEVKRLKKSSKMEELVLKRRCELEEVCREGHMDVNSDAARQSLVDLIDSAMVSQFVSDRVNLWFKKLSSIECAVTKFCFAGSGDLLHILASIDSQIEKAKEEALTRKEILDKVDKWKHAKK
ncbi:hypothetical protein DY000_02011540 [Brassica cretica]|uniref:Uncharacterized protein n=1 Tax=Brassica cretica TaxID=69181 RepID=A0ABQ7CRW8_BRACR|nr:hypothetical protein DY000_02011540 [Brassica cretica]